MSDKDYLSPFIRQERRPTVDGVTGEVWPQTLGECYLMYGMALLSHAVLDSIAEELYRALECVCRHLSEHPSSYPHGDYEAIMDAMCDALSRHDRVVKGVE